jgi:beta-lactamase superfamily II metal-dependent hydrolase
LKNTRQSYQPEKILTVHVFNVGQGDHLLVELPSGKFGLIDFHYDSGINLLNEPPGLTYLRKEHGKSRVILSFICISHPDLDHTTGLSKLFKWIKDEQIEVERLWLYPGVNEDDIQEALKKAIAELDKIIARNKASGITEPPPGLRNNSQIKRLGEDLQELWKFVKGWKPRSPDLLQGIGKLAKLDGLVEICPIAPLADQVRKSDQKALRDLFLWTEHRKPLALTDRNRVSSIIKMKFGPHQLWFGGDTGERSWQKSLEEFDRKHQNNEGPCYNSLKGVFIKASHHGAKDSSSVALWNRILAADAYVSFSAGWGYIHPNKQTLAEVLQASAGLGLSTRLLTTNLCERCLRLQNLPHEELNWLPSAKKTSSNKQVNEVIIGEAPISNQNEEFAAPNPFTRQALAHDRPIPPRKPESRRTKSLGGYVLRFSLENDKVLVSQALMPAVEEQVCVYGYQGVQQFPDCANPK